MLQNRDDRATPYPTKKWPFLDAKPQHRPLFENEADCPTTFSDFSHFGTPGCQEQVQSDAGGLPNYVIAAAIISDGHGPPDTLTLVVLGESKVGARLLPDRQTSHFKLRVLSQNITANCQQNPVRHNNLSMHYCSGLNSPWHPFLLRPYLNRNSTLWRLYSPPLTCSLLGQPQN